MSKKQETMGNALEAGHTPSETVPMGYKRTEAGMIPEEWDICTLPDVIDKFVNGGTPSTSNTDFWSGDIPWITGADILNQMVAVIRRYITKEAVHNSSTNIIAKGNLLIVSRTGVGKLAIAPCDIAISQDFTGLIHNKEKILAQYLFRHFDFCQQVLSKQNQGTSIKGITRDTLAAILIPLPSLHEQRAIAKALSDVDGLLGALEKLIAKKRAVKQAAMQQLLTGKTRLPGFSGKWETKQLGEIASFFKGSGLSKADLSLDGRRRCIHYGELFTVYGECITKVLHGTDREGMFFYSIRNDVLMPTSDVTPNGLATASCILASDIVIGADVLVIRAPKSVLNGEFLAYAIKAHRDQVMQLVSGTTVFHLYARDMVNFTFAAPSVDEQTAIVAILSDMDAEIAALERRRDKARAVKQGMMQQLLTGRIRLIQPETRSVGRKHNWQFNEAVVISVLAKHFGNEQYPLGRMRYTKLSYLLHRREDGYAEGYLKMAAGPYNPRTRYGGPEKIALQKDYVRQHRSGKWQGFIASTNFDEAEGYFDRWYGSEALQWLKQFRYETNNELELLTTVDMAVAELYESGKVVSVERVKEVIRSHPEWDPKLDRPIFSDTNLARAIESCQKLFDY